MSEEPENLVLQILRQMRAEMGEMRADLGELKAEARAMKEAFLAKADFLQLKRLRADIASDLHLHREQLREQIETLHREVEGSHAAFLDWKRSFEAARRGFVGSRGA